MGYMREGSGETLQRPPVLIGTDMGGTFYQGFQ